MPLSVAIQAAALLFATVAAGVVAWHATRDRPSPAARYLAVLAVAAGIWDAAGAACILLPGLEQKIIAAQVQYVGIVAVSPCWFLFAHAYASGSGRRQLLARGWLVLLGAMYVLSVALAATNGWHELIWPDVTLTADGWRATFGHGPAFWAMAAWSYALLLGGTAILVPAFLRQPPAYRTQVIVLLLGVALPWAANIAYLANVTPIPGLDPTPLAFTFTGVVLLWGLRRLRVLGVVPIARSAVVEHMEEGMLVVDPGGAIVDANPAACSLLGQPMKLLVGGEADTFVPSWRAASGFTSTIILNGRDVEVRGLDLAGDAAAWGGRVVLLRDVTQQARQRARREGLIVAARRLSVEVDASNLQHTLCNEATRLVDGDLGILFQWDEAERLLRRVAGVGQHGDLVVPRPLGKGAAGLAAERQEAVLINDYLDWADVPEDTARLGVQAAVAVPLLHEGRLLGAIVVATRAVGRGFDAEDAGALEVLAGLGSAALVGMERVRLEGVLLAARTAEHELNNRLAITAGYAEFLLESRDLPEHLRVHANEAARGAQQAAATLDRLGRIIRLQETQWGEGTGSTIDLERSAPAPAQPRPGGQRGAA